MDDEKTSLEDMLVRKASEWVLCHTLAIGLFSVLFFWAEPMGWSRDTAVFLWMPLFHGCAQLYPLRRYVRWWSWIPACYLGTWSCFIGLQMMFLIMPVTVACFQGACLALRRPLLGILWVPCAVCGYLLALFGNFGFWWIWVFYAMALLPLVLWVEFLDSRQG